MSKFLNPLDGEEIESLLDTLSTSMLFYNSIKMVDLQTNPKLIESLTASLISMVKHNVVVKQVRDISIMEIGEEQLVKKVERNGRVFGVIMGGKE
jgi:hypothetical protein